MLPKECLVVQKRKGTIMPRYLTETSIAQDLIDLFAQSKGDKYKRIAERREEMEEHNFKVVRGLSLLLERRCLFTNDATLPSKAVREFLFERGFVRSQQEREALLKEAALQFHATPPDVEQAMFSDLRDEQVLSEFTVMNAGELIRQYNLSLTQTLLFDALGLHVKVVGNYQHLFRQIKYLGLMYEIDEGIRITGPGSLFKKNRKYGTSLAKLVPEIIKAQQWEIHAIIETVTGVDPRVCQFDLESTRKVPFPVVSEPSSHFDSEVEQQFYYDFAALNLGWGIVREPDVVKAGTSVIIPDFGFYKNGMKHYLEIVGFWTPEYLERKMAKLKEASVPITVAVNETLECKRREFPSEVIVYRNKIPLMEIVRILQRIEEQQVARELTELGEIQITQDVISIGEVAKMYHVNPQTIKELDIKGYQAVGEQLVSRGILETIKREIQPDEDYERVEEILRRYHVSSLVLDALGYQVVWQGLQPTKVVEKQTV